MSLRSGKLLDHLIHAVRIWDIVMRLEIPFSSCFDGIILYSIGEQGTLNNIGNQFTGGAQQEVYERDGHGDESYTLHHPTC
jgi:hypothetical protein